MKKVLATIIGMVIGITCVFAVVGCQSYKSSEKTVEEVNNFTYEMVVDSFEHDSRFDEYEDCTIKEWGIDENGVVHTYIVVASDNSIIAIYDMDKVGQ